MRKYLRIGEAKQDMSLEEARVYRYQNEYQPEAGFSTLQQQTEFNLALTKIKRTDPADTGITHAMLESFKLFELRQSENNCGTQNSKYNLLLDFTTQLLAQENCNEEERMQMKILA